MNNICVVGLVLGIFVSTFSWSVGLKTDLANGFNALSSQYGNVTRPGAYQGQSSGYYTGGSLYLRTQNRKTRLLGLSPPSFKAGCGGIDAHLGAFSMINSEQLVAAAKNIGANAVSYAFYLAIGKLCESCSNHMKTLQRWANSLNQANIDSCNTAKWAVSSVAGKKPEADKYRCAAFGSWNGVFQDFGAGLDACNQGKNDGAVNSNAKSPEEKEAYQPAVNIGWKVIQQLADVASGTDDELGEFLMSMTGTLIYRPRCLTALVGGVCTDAGYVDKIKRVTDQKTTIPITGKIDETLINALMYGTKTNGTPIKILKCVKNAITAIYDAEAPCLFTTLVTKTILENESIHFKIKAKLQSILTKVEDDVALNASEKSLIATTRIPVLKMMVVYNAYSPLQAQVAVTNYAEFVALDYVEAYLKGILTQVNEAAASYPHSPTLLEKYRKKVRLMNKALAKIIKKRRSRILYNIQLIKEVQVIERMLISTMSPGMAQSVRFVKTLR